MAGEGTLTAFNVKLSSGGSYFAPGIVVGGNAGIVTGWRTYHGAGGMVVNQAGDWQARPTLNCIYTADVAQILTAGKRTSYPKGAITETLYCQVGTSTHGWEIANCALNTVELSYRYDDPVSAALGFIGVGAITQDTDGVSQVALAAGQIPHRPTLITLDGSAAECFEFTAGWDNQYEYRGHGDERASGVKRAPNLLAKGLEAPRLRMGVLVPQKYAMTADSPDITHDVVITIGDGTNSTTLTYTNVGIEQDGFDIRGEENGFVDCIIDFHCYPGCLALS